VLPFNLAQSGPKPVWWPGSGAGSREVVGQGRKDKWMKKKHLPSFRVRSGYAHVEQTKFNRTLYKFMSRIKTQHNALTEELEELDLR